MFYRSLPLVHNPVGMSPGHPALISEDAAPTHNCIPGSRCQAGDIPSLPSAAYLLLLRLGTIEERVRL